MVRIDDVVVNGVVAEHHAKAERDTRRGGPNPDNMFERRSAENEHCDRDKGGSEKRRDESVFGCRGARLADAPELLLHEGGDEKRETGADQDRDEHQADLSVVVAVQFAEDNGEGEEEAVEHGVDEDDVHAHQVEDGLGEDHGDRADEVRAHDLPEAQFDFFLLGDDVGVAGFLAELFGAALQNDRGVGFWYQADDDHDHAGKGHVGPEEEVQAVRTDVDPAAYDGAHDGTAVGCCGEERNGHAALFDIPDIRNGPASQRQTGTGEDAAKETAGQQSTDIGRKRAGYLEDGVQSERDDIHGTTADDLRQRTPEQRPNRKPTDHDGDGQRSHFERNVILVLNQA